MSNTDSSAPIDPTKAFNDTAGGLIEQLRGWVPGKNASDDTRRMIWLMGLAADELERLKFAGPVGKEVW